MTLSFIQFFVIVKLKINKNQVSCILSLQLKTIFSELLHQFANASFHIFEANNLVKSTIQLLK